MMRTSAVSASAALALVACNLPSPYLGQTITPLEEQGPFGHVTIVSALIGPAKASGDVWDGTGGKLDHEAVRLIAGALAASNPATAISMAMAPIIESGVEPPDVFGVAEVFTRYRTSQYKLPKRNDTFSPSWAVDVSRVPLSADTRIRIKLTDSDDFGDDDVGVVEINADDLVRARDAARVYPIVVAEQSQNQILIINVSVRAAD